MARRPIIINPDIVDATFIDITPGAERNFFDSLFAKRVHRLKLLWAQLSFNAILILFVIGIGVCLNAIQMRWLNAIPFAIIGIVILVKGYSPKPLAWVVGLGTLSGLLDGDDQTTGRDGFARGVKLYHRGIMTFLFGYWFCMGLLTLHPWHQNPMGFVSLMIVIVFVLVMYEAYGKKLGNWIVYLGTIYAVIIALLSFGSTIPNTWRGEVFDPETGLALYMMDPGSETIGDETPYYEYTTADCMPAGPDGGSKCHSPKTGIKLVPMTKDAAERFGVGGISREVVPGLSWIEKHLSVLGGAMALLIAGGAMLIITSIRRT